MNQFAPGPILVVEDCDEDFDTVLEAARRAGVPNEIRRATTGDAGLEMLRTQESTPSNPPALVLMDLNTPQGDGRAALLAIKMDARLRHLPVVVFSTSNNPRDLNYCYAHGANSYHIKPVNHSTHLQVLEKIFGYWLTAVALPTNP